MEFLPQLSVIIKDLKQLKIGGEPPALQGDEKWAYWMK
jgi:hypothetical protein